MTKKQKRLLYRLIIAAVLLISGVLSGSLIKPSPQISLFSSDMSVAGLLSVLLLLCSYLIVGYDILIDAAKGIFSRQPFDECFLMSLATVGALALGNYTEAVFVMLFYQLGELFQSYAIGKSRRSISALMDIRPDVARLVSDDGSVNEEDPDNVPVGSIIEVKPGEKIPIDGRIIKGTSLLDTVALTGESVPKSCREGDEVLSGSINLSGLLHIETTKEFGESTASKILELVENAASHKSVSESFISRFAMVYTPAVCIGALAAAVMVPLFRMMLGLPADWNTWIYRALTFLVVSCPCALVISIPLTFFAALGAAGSRGVLIKGSNYLEALSKLKYLVFDKTGTLTKGSFDVVGIHHSVMPDEELLMYAAAAERGSIHPISDSIRRAAGPSANEASVENITEIAGYGITADVNGRAVILGNGRLMEKYNVEYVECSHPGTVVHIIIDDEYAGHILISDELKPDAVKAIVALKNLGINKLALLTGDRKKAAESVAAVLNIEKVYSELLPGDKVSIVEELLTKKKPGDVLGFAGDGINDAPVLTRADIGIAMGALGSDAAIEAADVVLMDDSPEKIAAAVKLSVKCMRIVKENTWFAIGIKLTCLIFSALGLSGMRYAIFADVGVMVLAVLNALRMLAPERKKYA